MTDMDDCCGVPEELEVVFGQLRQRYGQADRPQAGPELVSLFGRAAGEHDDVETLLSTTTTIDESGMVRPEQTPPISLLPTGRPRPMGMVAAAIALVGTTVGKLTLGATVAAIGVGAGQAAGVIDLPGLPGPSPVLLVETVDDVDDVDDADDVDDVDQRDVPDDGLVVVVDDDDEDEGNPSGRGGDDQDPVEVADDAGNPARAGGDDVGDPADVADDVGDLTGAGGDDVGDPGDDGDPTSPDDDDGDDGGEVDDDAPDGDDGDD